LSAGPRGGWGTQIAQSQRTRKYCLLAVRGWMGVIVKADAPGWPPDSEPEPNVNDGGKGDVGASR